MSMLLTIKGETPVIEVHGAFPETPDAARIWQMALELIESGYRSLLLDLRKATLRERAASAAVVSLQLLFSKAGGSLSLYWPGEGGGLGDPMIVVGSHGG